MLGYKVYYVGSYGLMVSVLGVDTVKDYYLDRNRIRVEELTFFAPSVRDEIKAHCVHKSLKDAVDTYNLNVANSQTDGLTGSETVELGEIEEKMALLELSA